MIQVRAEQIQIQQKKLQIGQLQDCSVIQCHLWAQPSSKTCSDTHHQPAQTTPTRGQSDRGHQKRRSVTE
eukprot:3938197-Rhodomonas_salina.5